MTGAVVHHGRLGPDDAEYRAITPPGWDGEAHLPLLLVLHGANSSAAVLDPSAYEELWSSGAFPAAVVACVSTPTLGGFYIDAPAAPPGAAGRWESLVADAFPRHLADRFNADLDRVALLGSSMGGYGALKIAFAAPHRFTAVAAIAPTVFPGEAAGDVRPRNTLGVLKDLHAAMAAGSYARQHVVARLRRNADAIRDGGPAILLECGGDDCFRLQDGAEYLHRVLWDLDINHEFHLIRGADHVGPSRHPRERAARLFLASALAPPPAAEVPTAFRAWLDGGGGGPMPAVDFDSPEGPAVLRLMLEPEVRALDDPRHYGTLG